MPWQLKVLEIGEAGNSLYYPCSFCMSKTIPKKLKKEGSKENPIAIISDYQGPF